MVEIRPRAVEVMPLKNYELQLIFSNGECRFFDMNPYLNHPAFKALQNIELFKSVKISGLSIAWANGADICPDELYYNSMKK